MTQTNDTNGLHDHPGLLATTYGIVSAVGYMLANICLRSVTDLDPVWVSQVKAVPTVVGVAPLIILRLIRSQPLMPSGQILTMIVAVAALGQLGGNVAFQWSLSVIGIAICVPLTLGAMIVSGAILGWTILGDRISRSMAMASTLLIVAIGVLSLGAPQANASMQHSPIASQPRVALVLAGVAAACFSGCAYSCLGVALRFASNRGTPVSSLLFVVALTGFVLLGAMVYARQQRFPTETLQGSHFLYLVAAGTFNLLAFAALTKALHLSSVLFVNALNASQTAMAAVIGVAMFNEAISLPMVTGVSLTVVGLLMMKGRRRQAKLVNPASEQTIHASSQVLGGPK